MKLWNLGLTDKRTHNKLIIRLWAYSAENAEAKFRGAGMDEEYELRYVREDTFYTKEA